VAFDFGMNAGAGSRATRRCGVGQTPISWPPSCFVWVTIAVVDSDRSRPLDDARSDPSERSTVE